MRSWLISQPWWGIINAKTCQETDKDQSWFRRKSEEKWRFWDMGLCIFIQILTTETPWGNTTYNMKHIKTKGEKENTCKDKSKVAINGVWALQNMQSKQREKRRWWWVHASNDNIHSHVRLFKFKREAKRVKEKTKKTNWGVEGEQRTLRWRKRRRRRKRNEGDPTWRHPPFAVNICLI